MEIPKILLEYMLTPKAYVFVDDFSGWGAEAQIPGFDFVSDSEGNLLKSARGEIFGFQYESLRRGNHLKVRLEDCSEGQVVEQALAELPLFKEFDVVISTSNEKLRCFAPLCATKLEVIQFIQAIRDYPAGGEISRMREDMERLALYLYRNNPSKKKCILDELDID